MVAAICFGLFCTFVLGPILVSLCTATARVHDVVSGKEAARNQRAYLAFQRQQHANGLLWDQSEGIWYHATEAQMLAAGFRRNPMGDYAR